MWNSWTMQVTQSEERELQDCLNHCSILTTKFRMHGVKFDQLKKRKHGNNLFCDFKVTAVFYVNNKVRTFDAFVTLFNICTIYDRIILDLEMYSFLCTHTSWMSISEFIFLFYCFAFYLHGACQSFMINLLSTKLKKIFLYLWMLLFSHNYL